MEISPKGSKEYTSDQLLDSASVKLEYDDHVAIQNDLAMDITDGSMQQTCFVLKIETGDDSVLAQHEGIITFHFFI